jgi:putative tricarboxylic transport membrane protein
MVMLSRVSKAFLVPAVLFFCIVGAYANSGKMYDIWVMLGFGVLGYMMEKARIPLAPFTIGFVLAPIAESNLRTGLMISDGSLAPLWSNSLPAALTAIALLVAVSPWLSLVRRR